MGNCLEKFVVKTVSENQILRRNRDFLKQAENPATFSKPGEVTESQPSNHGNSVQTTLTERRQLPVSLLAPDVKRTRTGVIRPPSRLNDCYLAPSFIKKDWDFSRFVFSSLQSHLLLRQLKLWKFIIILFSVLFFVPYYSLFPFVLLASWSGKFSS